MSIPRFHDRADAGRQLAVRLDSLRGEKPLLVVGIAPNGVPIAYVIAVALGAPLEAWVARQLHSHDEPHEHVGALAEDQIHGHPVEHAAPGERASSALEDLAASERVMLEAQAGRIHRHPRLSMRNHTVIVVDDGVATGATLRATIRAIRQEKPRRVVVALPVASPSALAHIERYVDGVVCLGECHDASGIGASYETHEVIDDAAVAELLQRRHHEWAPSATK